MVTYAKQVCQHHFVNSMCSPSVSVSHFDNFYNILNFFTIIVSILVICNQQSLMLPLKFFGNPQIVPM